MNLETDPSPARWKQWVMFPLKFLLGMAFCQLIAGSMLVIGWSFRFAQRAAWKTLWKRSPLQKRGATFSTFLSGNPDTRQHLHWPNWFFRQNFIQTNKGASKFSLFAGLTESLRRNFWLGFQGFFCTSVLTLPPLLLIWFGWDYGWNMSFHKGYEQFYVGTSTALIGILAFIAAMFYIPMAQARQAVTGDWRSFFHFRLVWQVSRENWAGCLGLAILITALSLPANVLKTLPMFLMGQGNFPGIEAMAHANPRLFLERYFFVCGVYILPTFVILRVLAAKVYAIGLLRGLRKESIGLMELAQIERAVINRLELLKEDFSSEKSGLKRFVAWLGTRVGRIFSGILMFAIWLGFIIQLVASEFLNYHTAGRGWLNQPLIQLPWFQYLPDSMIQSGQNVLAAIILVALCAIGHVAIKYIQSYRK